MEQLATSPEPIRIFYSYSHKDESLRRRLETHLASLRRQGLIIEWHDRQIEAGEGWKSAIDQNLQAAHIVLLLVSPDFINSDYCYSIEMTAALERHDSGEARVIPIIMRPCVWTALPFGKLQALPKDGKPLTTWSNRDLAFVDITTGIQKAVEKARSREVKPKVARSSDINTPQTSGTLSQSQLEQYVAERITLERSNSFLTDSDTARLRTYRSLRDMRELRSFAESKGIADGFVDAPIWNKDLPRLLDSLVWRGELSSQRLDELIEQTPVNCQFSTSALNVLACLSVLSMQGRRVPVRFDPFHGSGHDLMKSISFANTPPQFILLSNSGLAFARNKIATEYQLLLSVYADEQRLFKRVSTGKSAKERIHIVPFSSSQEGLAFLLKTKKLRETIRCRWTTIEQIASPTDYVKEGELCIVWGGLVAKYSADKAFVEIVEGRHQVGISLFCHNSVAKNRTLVCYFCEAFVACWNNLARNPEAALAAARRNPEYLQVYRNCIGLS